MIKGIKNGMVMQRNEKNVCDILFKSDAQVSAVSVSNPYDKPYVEKVGDSYRLCGVSVGGPYTLKIGGEQFCDIYVGDVWLLIGQSNMQGIGRMVGCGINNNHNIRALYMHDEWDTANHPLHRPNLAKHEVHNKVLSAEQYNFSIKGAGPGVAFAEKMYELTRVPQGLICCAHGGTNLYQDWSPSLLNRGGKSLYGAAYDRFVNNGSNVRGAFWYQGESDGAEQPSEKYEQNMIDFVAALRRDFKSGIPIVQVQISRCSWAEADNLPLLRGWSRIREIQRNLHKKIDKLDTVHTIAYRLADCIHLSAAAQQTVGNDAAQAMFCMLYGKLYGCLPGIKLRDIEIVQDNADANMCEVILSYDNVHGQLDAGSRAMGFELSSDDEKPGKESIYDVYCDGSRVMLRCDCSKENIKGKYLWYGFGRECACNITDSQNRSLPAFGPIQVM